MRANPRLFGRLGVGWWVCMFLKKSRPESPYFKCALLWHILLIYARSSIYNTRVTKLLLCNKNVSRWCAFVLLVAFFVVWSKIVLLVEKLSKR